MSVGPQYTSGYGVVCRNVVGRLQNYDFSIFVLDIAWKGDGCLLQVDGKIFNICPYGEKTIYNIQALAAAIQKYDIDYIILHYDIWGMDPRFISMFHGTLIPYMPLDSILTPCAAREYRELLKDNKYNLVFSNFAVKESEKLGIKAVFIPHGVDCSVFRPMPEQKKALRKKFGFPENAFLCGFVGRNHSDRKRIDRLVEIFCSFAADKSDVYLYLHTNPLPSPGGAFGISMLAYNNHAHRKVITPEPDYTGFSLPELAELYNCFDVYVTASSAEGCGLPLLEAQACGIPVICPDNSAQTELNENPDFCVPCTDWIVSLANPLHLEWPLVDRMEFKNRLELAYNDKKDLLERGAKACEKIREKYDWDNVVEKQWKPFLEKL